MDATTQAATLPTWIAQANELALGWYTALRRPDQSLQVLRPPTAAINVGASGVSATIDPTTLVIGVAAIVLVIWIVRQ